MELSPQAVKYVEEIMTWLEWKATQLTKSGATACGVAATLLGREAARLTVDDTFRIFDRINTRTGWPWPQVSAPTFEQSNPDGGPRPRDTNWTRSVAEHEHGPFHKISHTSLVEAMRRLSEDRVQLITALTVDEETETALEIAIDLVDDVVQAPDRVRLNKALDSLTPEACRVAVEFALFGRLTPRT